MRKKKGVPPPPPVVESKVKISQPKAIIEIGEELDLFVYTPRYMRHYGATEYQAPSISGDYEALRGLQKLVNESLAELSKFGVG